MIRYTYKQRKWMIRYTYTQRTQKTLGHAAVRPRGHDSSICSPPTTFATLLQQKNRREATLLQHKQVTIRPCARAPRAPTAHGRVHGHGSWPRPAGMR